VSNLGTSGADGVRFEIPPLPPAPPGGSLAPQTGHEEWVELGESRISAIDVGSLTPGAYIQFAGSATIDSIPSTQVITTVEKGATLAEITSDFTDVDAITSLEYKLYQEGGGIVTVEVLGAIDTMLADRWPQTHRFSEIVWDQPSLVTLPGDVPRPTRRVDIEPLPSVPDRIEDASSGEIRGRKSPVFGPPGQVDLTEFAIELQTLGGGPQPACIPTLSSWGLVVLVAMMIGGALFLIRRSRSGRVSTLIPDGT